MITKPLFPKTAVCLDHDEVGRLLCNDNCLYYCPWEGGHMFLCPSESTLPEAHELVQEKCPSAADLTAEHDVLTAYEQSGHPPMDKVHCTHCAHIMNMREWQATTGKHRGFIKFWCPNCSKTMNLIF